MMTKLVQIAIKLGNVCQVVSVVFLLTTFSHE
jgi:hypothetical protein